jgi:CSLREA domain-containing protein
MMGVMRYFSQPHLRITGPAALAALAALLLWAPGALAATFTVTKTTDTADGKCDADCSLREAVIAANATAAPDTIVVPPGTYQLTLAGPEEDAAATGDLDLTQPVEVVGAGARTTVIRGDGSDRVFDVLAEGAVAISGVTIEGGRGVAQGAGINTASDTTSFTLRDAAVQDNRTTDPATVSTRQGAGLFLDARHSTIERVLVSGNVAASIPGDGFGPQGAGLFINGVTSLTNDTITGNVLEKGGGSSPAQGGGVFVNEVTTMTNVTLSNNTMSGGEGGGVFYNESTTMSHTIVTGNTSKGSPDQCVTNSPVTSLDGNLSTEPIECSFTQPGDVSADPSLLPLADNGGPTDTEALAPGSPAIDRVPFANCPGEDQRGFARAGAGGGCDFGAFESGAPASPASTPTPTPTQNSSPSPTPISTPTPKILAPLSANAAFSFPSPRKCVSRRHFIIHIRKLPGITFVSATVKVNGKRVKVFRGSQLTAPVDLRGLPKGLFTVSITAKTSDGRTVTGKRSFHTCERKRPFHGHSKL